ncbi:hypothetical protein PS6_010316 [Mucor atramentarius]
MLPNDQNTSGTIGAVVPVSSNIVEEQLIRQDQIIQQLLNRMNQYEDTVKLLTETMAEDATLKARVLDVHFPARNISGIKPIHNFFPEDPAILSDPALQSLSLEEKADIVTEIHQNRCMRITARAPKHVQAALAYHFISSGIFTRTYFNNYRYPSTSNNTNEQDIHMFETNNVSETEEPQ